MIQYYYRRYALYDVKIYGFGSCLLKVWQGQMTHKNIWNAKINFEVLKQFFILLAHSREIVVDNENNKSNDGENGHNGRFSDGNTNIYDDEEDEEEEEDDEEEEEEEEDDEDKIAEQMADMDICDDEEEEDDDDELDNYDIEYDEEDDIQGSRENSQEKSLKGIRERISPSMGLDDDDEEEEEEDEDDDDEALDDLISSEKCDCFHCKRQAQNEQKVKIILYF